MTTVDGHVHVFKTLSTRYPRDVHAMFPPDMEAPIEDLLSTMDAHDVDKAVLVALSPHDEYLHECLAAHGDRLAGIGVLDRDRSGDAEHVRRRLSHLGMRGLRIHHLGAAARRAEHLTTWPVLEALHDLDGVVWLYVPQDELQLMPLVLDRLPGLRVVLNHLGWGLPDEFEVDALGRPTIKGPIPPPTMPTVRDLARYESVHVMFSGEYAFSSEDFPFSDLGAVVRSIYDAYGAGRMLWASDYPWIEREPGYGPQLTLVDHYLPDICAAERASIMGRTAARLFGF